MIEIMIKTTNLTKIYNDGFQELRALDGIDLEIKEGDFIAVTGRSGSGKSTLLYQLSLLDRPTSGTLIINKKDTVKIPDTERTAIRLQQMGYIFQDYALIPTLTAEENVMMPLLMQGFSKKEATTKSINSLTKVGLKDYTHHLPNQLSGGQQQRVSIARAIVHSPRILFADEPTANLDHKTSISILKLFLNLNRQGQTIIMVTHEEDYAKIAKRIITFFDGKIKNEK